MSLRERNEWIRVKRDRELEERINLRRVVNRNRECDEIERGEARARKAHSYRNYIGGEGR